MSDSYDQRRERCMLDQTSSVGTPMHVILRSPAELQVRYSDEYPEIKDFTTSFNALAVVNDPPEQRTAREQLAEKADQLQNKYAGQHLLELSQLLEHAAAYLRGDYPLHPVQVLPSLHIDS